MGALAAAMSAAGWQCPVHGGQGGESMSRERQTRQQETARQGDGGGDCRREGRS